MGQGQLDKRRILGVLRANAGIAEATAQLIELLVPIALQNGATWAEIGDALGVSASAAHQKHAKRR